MSIEHKGKIIKDKEKSGDLLDSKKNGEILKNDVPEGKKLWINDTLNEKEKGDKRLNEFTLF